MVEAVAPGHREANVAEPFRLALGRGVDIVDVDEHVGALARVTRQSGARLRRGSGSGLEVRLRLGLGLRLRLRLRLRA